MTARKTMALTRLTFVDKVMSLLFNMRLANIKVLEALTRSFGEHDRAEQFETVQADNSWGRFREHIKRKFKRKRLIWGRDMGWR